MTRKSLNFNERRQIELDSTIGCFTVRAKSWKKRKEIQARCQIMRSSKSSERRCKVKERPNAETSSQIMHLHKWSITFRQRVVTWARSGPRIAVTMKIRQDTLESMQAACQAGIQQREVFNWISMLEVVLDTARVVALCRPREMWEAAKRCHRFRSLANRHRERKRQNLKRNLQGLHLSKSMRRSCWPKLRVSLNKTWFLTKSRSKWSWLINCSMWSMTWWSSMTCWVMTDSLSLTIAHLGRKGGRCALRCAKEAASLRWKSSSGSARSLIRRQRRISRQITCLISRFDFKLTFNCNPF